MKINKKIIIGILIVILIPVISYTIEYAFKNAGLKSGAIIEISLNNQVAAYFGSDVLQKLPNGSGNGDEGPTLNSVLIAAGINNFSTIEISGGKDETPYKISSQDNRDEYRFYYTPHNTVNLAKKSESQNILVEDVGLINAKD